MTDDYCVECDSPRRPPAQVECEDMTVWRQVFCGDCGVAKLELAQHTLEHLRERQTR